MGLGSENKRNERIFRNQEKTRSARETLGKRKRNCHVSILFYFILKIFLNFFYSMISVSCTKIKTTLQSIKNSPRALLPLEISTHDLLVETRVLTAAIKPRG